MISTVTVSTISTITTMTGLEVAGVFGAVATVALIVLLTTSALVSVRASGFSQRMGRFLNVGIVPLLMVLTATVATAVATIL